MQRGRWVGIRAHVRRGDVSADDPETALRFVPIDIIASSIRQVRSMLAHFERTSRVRVFCQGNEKDFRTLQELGCELCLSTAAPAAFPNG
jgi:hypothetical protein